MALPHMSHSSKWPGSVLLASLVVLAIGFTAVTAATILGRADEVPPPGGVGVAWLLGLAALIIGILVGFVFGIPRALQQSRQGKEENGASPGSSYAPNTNLEQISDWLTKILVGVGLIELGSIGTGLTRLVDTIGPALADASTGTVLAAAEIAFFGPSGFLVGYILTRTYLARTFDYFDRISETVVSSVAIYAAQLDTAARQLRTSLPPEYSRSDKKSDGAQNNRELPGEIVKPAPKEVRDLGEFREWMDLLLAILIGPKNREIESIQDKIDTLQHRGVLDKPSSRALYDIAVVTALATEGTALPLDSHRTLGSSVHKILGELANLQPLAASRFEHHVLETLSRNAPADWSIQSDVRIINGGFMAETTGEKLKEVVPRVDAVICDSHGQFVVVEVRSRIESTESKELESLKNTLKKISPEVPVIVVTPDGGVRREHLSQDHRRRLHVLDWDTRADLLMPTIHESFMAPLLTR